jgi:predicted nucleic acid-binding protein
LAEAAERHVFGTADGVAAPDLLNAEVLHVIRRYERRGIIDRERSRVALGDLLDLPVARYPTLPLLERAWGLRGALIGYDAMYVALAEALEGALVTFDARLASAARRHVEVVRPG